MNSSRLRSISGNLHAVQRAYPPLTADEEKKLREKYADDRDRLGEALVLHSIGFAVDFVRRYHERSEDPEDMWMRGLQGLSEAARRADPSSSFRFCTFAGDYIRGAMCDLYHPHLVAPRTQRATQAAYDAPVDQDGEGPETAGDYLALTSSAPGWEPVRPDSEPRRRASESDATEMVGYLANRFGESAQERDIIRARLLGWTCEDVGRRILGVGKRYAAKKCEAVMSKMCRAIRSLGGDDELSGVFGRIGATVPRRCSPFQLRGFVANRRVEIVDDVEFETLEDRKSRLVEEYDAAEAEHRLATGRRDEGGADYAMMRLVYMETVASCNGVADVAEHRGIPMSYVKYLRDRAVKMVKDSKNGTLRRLVRKHGIHGIDPEGHHIKDELFNTVSYPEPFDPEGGSANYVVKYDRIVEQMTTSRDRAARRERNLRRRLLATWKNYGGGFYSEENHLRLSGRTKNGKTRLTKREIRALAQFCDDISPA